MTMTMTTMISNRHSTPNPTTSNCSQGGKGQQWEGTMTTRGGPTMRGRDHNANDNNSDDHTTTTTTTTIAPPTTTASNCSRGGKGEQREGTTTRGRGEDNEEGRGQ